MWLGLMLLMLSPLRDYSCPGNLSFDQRPWTFGERSHEMLQMDEHWDAKRPQIEW
jgi:hypothetical protein